MMTFERWDIMRYTQLRAFDAVAREGSFTKAAIRLNLTQPAVTVQVRGLEETYGVLLFDRNKKGVELTDVGRTMFTMSRQMLGIEEQVRELLTASHKLETGELRVAAGGPHVSMDLIAAFVNHYPGVRLSVTFGNAREVWQTLLEHRTDVVIIAGAGEEERVKTVPFSRQRIIALVSRNHRWASRSSISIKDLDGEPAVLREEASATQQIVNRALDKAGVRVRQVLQLGSREAVQEAVASSLGIGFVLERETGQDDRIHVLKLNGVGEDIHDSVSCLRSQSRRRVVQAFLDLAKELKTT